MERIFTRNMFIMLLSIMIGAIIITFFIADIQHKSEIETLTTGYTDEISTITRNNENFTGYFLYSLGILDQAREDRAFGNYHYDLGFLWYNSMLSETNLTTFEQYQSRAVENCTNAMPKYMESHDNFEVAINKFIETKNYTSTPKYRDILDLYIALSESGARLTYLRYNASNYLKQITAGIELTINPGNGSVTLVISENISEMIELFEQTLGDIAAEEEIFEDLKDEIDEYPFFDEIR